VIRSSVTGEVVAAGTYNETNLINFADFIASLLLKYEDLILVPERRSSAVTIIDYLIKILKIHNINPFKRIFNWVYDDIDKFKTKYPNILSKHYPGDEIMNSLRKYLGYGTSGGGKASRDNLYCNVFTNSVKYTANTVRDNILAGELLGLTVRNGRIDHLRGGHDDMVVAWLLPHWFLLKAENKHLYTNKVDNILTDIVNNELIANANNDVDKEKIKEQEKLRMAINQYIQILKNEKNEYKALLIVNKIKQLESKIDTKIIKNFNIDNLLKEIKILKRIEKLKK
jgi:hypothetical protein